MPMKLMCVAFGIMFCWWYDERDGLFCIVVLCRFEAWDSIFSLFLVCVVGCWEKNVIAYSRYDVPGGGSGKVILMRAADGEAFFVDMFSEIDLNIHTYI